MNQTISLLTTRRTHRSFLDKTIAPEEKRLIQEATLRAPTAGNMMFYSVIEVNDQAKKERLAQLCDNQPIIAKAPLVWLFLSDSQKWVNYYHESGSVAQGQTMGIKWRSPGAGDLLLSMSDALIAAQSAVIAAESLGIGSCYIGDIIENYEQIKALFNLSKYTAVATLLIFGYPKNPNPLQIPAIRCPVNSIFMEDTYQEPHLEALNVAFGQQEERLREQHRLPFENKGSISDYFYFRKHTSDFMQEMNRSGALIIENWIKN
ncbi:MAG: nitroreductase family protein [Sphaerochaetaceae bacterium]